jgi:hypothetical protein
MDEYTNMVQPTPQLGNSLKWRQIIEDTDTQDLPGIDNQDEEVYPTQEQPGNPQAGTPQQTHVINNAVQSNMDIHVCSDCLLYLQGQYFGVNRQGIRFKTCIQCRLTTRELWAQMGERQREAWGDKENHLEVRFAYNMGEWTNVIYRNDQAIRKQQFSLI